MEYFACVLLFWSFAYIESLNPRSVNVELETVLEFDGKHTNRDVKAIDKLQNYLNRIKKIINKNDDSRRHLTKGYKFRDFLKTTLETISSFDDNELLDIVAIANNEIRKYHYKGCKFYELVENQNMRRDMAERLGSLNELTAKELRVKLDVAIRTLENNAMTEKKRKMLEYLDSVYVGEDIKSKMDRFSAQLETFKQRSKRANLNLVKVINEGLRSIIFDYYTDLNANVRSELKERFESFWLDFQNSKKSKLHEKEYNIKKDKDRDIKRESTTFKATVETNSDLDFDITHPKMNILRSKPERKKTTKKSKLLLETLSSSNLKYKTKTAESEETRETRPTADNKRKKLQRSKKYKWKIEKKGKKSVNKSIFKNISAEEEFLPVLVGRSRAAIDYPDFKKRADDRKEKRRENGVTAPILRSRLKKTRRSNDYEEDLTEEGLHIQTFEKQTLKNRILRDETEATIAPAPNVVKRINNMEKVLDEIKTLVSMQQRRKGSDEEKIVKTTTLLARKTTVTPKLTTQISSPVTDATTTTGTSTKKLEIKPTKPIIVEEFTKSTKTTIDIKSKPASIEDTTILSKKYTTTTTKITPEATETTTTEKSTTNTPELPSTVKISQTLASDNNDININSLLHKISDNDTHYSDNYKLRRNREAKEENLTDLDIEHMFNETRRSGLHNVIHGDAEDDKEMNRKIKDRIAGHIKKIMAISPTDGMTTRFDFSLDDPFGLKDDLYNK